MTQLFLIPAGGSFVIACALASGILIAPRTVLPLSVRFMTGAILTSAVVFLALTIHVGFLLTWLVCGAIVMTIAALRFRHASPAALPCTAWYFRVLFGCYGAVYLIHAFAPEIEPDAITYHLGLVSEYVRLHAFSNRTEFYEVLPQGVEMLFVPAFAIGAHSAARLVHFSFLIATVSLLRHICRELGIADAKACCAAALFFIAPVVAVTATSAYTDIALVCCVCAVLYLLIRWDRDRTTSLLLIAGLNAGFCYAIKPTFGWVALVALGFVLFRARFVCTAALATPWMMRAAVLTGNPFAPFLSAWLPNATTTPMIEAGLFHSYAAFRSSFSWKSAMLDYTIRGGNQGILGPAFLLLPVALLALRTRAGRWLVTAASLLAIPILANTGTRFLMPALAPASIAMVSVLPLPAAFALVGVQMIGAGASRVDWRLPEIPLRAALRIEPEEHYLARSIADFANDTMIMDATPAGARIYAMAPIHQAYLSRAVLVYWQSAQADRFLDYLAFAHDSWGQRAALLSWRWPMGTYQAVRLTARSNLRIVEGPRYAMPWSPWKAGDLMVLPASHGSTGADLLIWPCDPASMNTEAQTRSGEWQSLDGAALKITEPLDIRRDVTAYIRRSGYRYILISAETGQFAEIGKDMREHPVQWGVEPAASNNGFWLFYISAGLS